MKDKFLELITRKDGKLNGKRTNDKWFIDSGNKALLDYFYSATDQLTIYDFRQRAFLWSKNILIPPPCDTCGAPVKIDQKVIHRFCSIKCLSSSQEIQQQKNDTILNKYGVVHPMKLDSFKNKVKNTVQSKYGVNSSLQRPDIREKIRNTNLEKYGAVNPMQNKTIRAAAAKTYAENWLNDPIKKEELRNKIKKTCNAKYDRDSNLQLCLDKNTIEKLENQNWLVNEYTTKEKSASQIAHEINCNYKTVLTYLRKYNTSIRKSVSSSRFEDYLKEFLEDNGVTQIISNDRTVLEGREIDLLMPNINLGIEFNGIYFHSSKDKFYHQQKTLDAKKKNIDLIHITDFDYKHKEKFIKNLLIGRLGKLSKIYARDTLCKEISSLEASNFLIENHIQGTSKAKIKLGLFYNNELVQVATFGPPRFNKNYTWELIRLTTKMGHTVVGGFSKLMKNFTSQYKGTIISYVDMQYFTGKAYEKTGWVNVGITQPGYLWIKNNIIYTRYQTQKHKLKNILQNYNSILTEEENMKNAGFLKYWNAGNLVYSLNI